MVYDPTVGKFLSMDPTGLVVDPNPYRYVGNDPTNLVDPTGLRARARPQALCSPKKTRSTQLGIGQDWVANKMGIRFGLVIVAIL
jgi:uncharacterized protein RhaS with RHS repeats